MIRGSHIIITDHKGRISLQQRAETASKSPGKWGLWGGHQEEGETPLLCALRELEEETGIKVEADDLVFLGDFEHRSNEYEMIISAFHLKLNEAPVITLGEGQGYGMFYPEEIAHLSMTLSSKNSLELLQKSL